jgi:hypothetical protein
MVDDPFGRWDLKRRHRYLIIVGMQVAESATCLKNSPAGNLPRVNPSSIYPPSAMCAGSKSSQPSRHKAVAVICSLQPQREYLRHWAKTYFTCDWTGSVPLISHFGIFNWSFLEFHPPLPLLLEKLPPRTPYRPPNPTNIDPGCYSTASATRLRLRQEMGLLGVGPRRPGYPCAAHLSLSLADRHRTGLSF